MKALARRRAAARTERGVVLPMFGLMLGALLGAAGFGIDLGNWYLQADRIQKAADAAALAGSTYLPGDLPSAKTVATASLTSNNAPADRAVITQSSLHPTQLNVKVTKTVPNYVISAIGITDMTFTRQATGEFRPFVPMGSPSNVLGQEPGTTDTWESSGSKSNYWLNVSGGSTYKDNGDRWSGGACNSGTDRCSTGAAVPTGNTDYSEDGQIYVVRVNDNTSGQLRIQAYDPVFAHVGDHCGSNLGGTPTTADNRYGSGGTNTYCTGDNLIGVGSRPPTDTTFELWTPADSPGGSRPISITNCRAKTYEGYNGNIASKLSSDAGFRAAFRQWDTVCQFQLSSSYPPGDYLLHVTTPTDERGMNRFALRAAIMQSNSTPDKVLSKNVAIFSQGRLVIYARTQSTNVDFYLARITSTAAGHTMTVTLFDIGDAAGPVTMRIIPPADADLNRFDGCTYNRPNTTSYIATSGGCTITSGSGWNGRLVNIQVPIPADYACKDSDPDGCWTKIRISFSSGNVEDTTSWEVGLDGQPVHLVPTVTN